MLPVDTLNEWHNHIHYYLIEEAKNILISTDKSAGEVAYSLGFEYP